MKNNVMILLCACLLLIQACTKDNSTAGNRSITEVEVNLGIANKAIIDINKNDVYSLKPEIVQDRDIPLTYEWEVNHVKVSTDRDFEFVGKDLGNYKVRLKVSNEDGSTFKEFTIRVNSQYEEGLIILAEDSNEEGSLSFIPKASNALIAQTPLENVDINSFETNNPGLSLGQKPSDLVIREYQFFVAAQEGVISFLNHNTLELEGEIRAPEFPDFKPFQINVPDNNARSAQILTSEGKVFTFATLEFVISRESFTANKLFALKSQIHPTINYTTNFYWEPATSKLWDMSGYWNLETGNTLQGQDLIHFFIHDGRCIALTSDKSNPSLLRKTVFGDFITQVVESHTFTKPNNTFKSSSITLLDDYYFKMIYANGRDIYRWFYSTNDIPDAPYIRLDIPGEITCMAKDLENKELYVGVYDSNSTGLKGSVVVYDLETGVRKAAFQNIADKPVKLLFKKRKS